MVWGSMVAREINLEERQVQVPTPMIQEQFFSTLVAAILIVQDTVLTAPIDSSPIATTKKMRNLSFKIL